VLEVNDLAGQWVRIAAALGHWAQGAGAVRADFNRRRRHGSGMLRNMDELKRKEVCNGDSVIVPRAGDAISEPSKRVINRRPPDASAIALPTHCPARGYDVKRAEGAMISRCVGDLFFCRGALLG
jgi:hypothetical protein